MGGIIFACMAAGVDWPHIDKKPTKKVAELVLGREFSKDYLKDYELGDSIRNQDYATFQKLFKEAFGERFGAELLSQTIKMLAINPADRPSPKAVHEALKGCR